MVISQMLLSKWELWANTTLKGMAQLKLAMPFSDCGCTGRGCSGECSSNNS